MQRKYEDFRVFRGHQIVFVGVTGHVEVYSSTSKNNSWSSSIEFVSRTIWISSSPVLSQLKMNIFHIIPIDSINYTADGYNGTNILRRFGEVGTKQSRVIASQASEANFHLSLYRETFALLRRRLTFRENL